MGQVKEHNDKAIGKKKKAKTVTPSSIHTSLLCLILSGTILTLFLVIYTDEIPWHLANRVIDDAAKRFLGYYKPVHAVVIDAGSTGSRVLAYTFHKSYIGSNLVLDKELFEYNKPGLSSFAKEPKKGAAKIAALLELAKNEIPQEYWSKTPLIMKATAGLRLLPPEQAENLLTEVKKVFKETPFLTDDNSVEIMDGVDEGIFSWFTVNFLLNRINSNPANTVAALDLGGGSTQVTFAALTPSSLQHSDNIHKAVSPTGTVPVFTHSYLGLGLKAARKSVISHLNGDSANVTCECVNPVIKGRLFHYNGHDYYVSGLQEGYPTSKVLGSEMSVREEIPVVDFSKCTKIISAYIDEMVSIRKPPDELPSKAIFAFSYYYDKASQVGLIDFDKGGQIKIADFKKQAERVCHEANPEQPWICLDMTYIWLLLERGFELQLDTRIYLYKKIGGHEITWALGAAYDVLRKLNIL
ncbi:ectonucleoside triphosphate diphosphohydrolase 5 isoform X2 [Anthonomus grandis grandis]|uniref:ectonucleoside triphosphate diphosphohydrolase 5 isoform X2 n=1 Tax=Anthonomus grandis grandis TaxID=2921223 RepID=UPI0021669F51|nr:ectonucleoside triphosphate diphosphohydrolase 5 isoform X2 [Anthonomus grandis grandis]